MAPKKNDEGGDEKGKKKEKGEKAKTKSPAEFFSENKNIAGFDNPGKSLYTTIRELVENSLDACESISVLPDIEITIQELDGAELNRTLGLAAMARRRPPRRRQRAAPRARRCRQGRPRRRRGRGGRRRRRRARRRGEGSPKGKKGAEALYYRVVVRANGCGMKHEQIPEMLGRVLSGSKYGVRQTRQVRPRREDGPHLE